MVDFIESSPLTYALTVKPTVYVSHIRQFWSTAKIETTEEGTQILATVVGIHKTVTGSSLRRNLKLQNEEGISSLHDTEVFENLTLMGYNISPNQKFTFEKGQFSHQWKTYNFSKMIFDGLVKNVNNKGEGLGTPTEPHHTPSPKALPPSPTTHSSPTLPPIITTSIPAITPSETTPIRQYTRRARIAQSSTLPTIADEPASPLRGVSQGEACPTDSGFIADQDRATIAKSSTWPHDSAPRVTSPAADEGSMQQTIFELTALCTSLQRQHSELLAKFQAHEVEINRSLDEGEAAAERISDDSEEMATVLTSMDATTVLAGGIANVPTGSGSIPTASPPADEVLTGSDVVPTASPVFATTTVVTPYRRRKGKKAMVESETLKKQRVQEQIDAHVTKEFEEQLEKEDQRRSEQIARDAEIARIHAEEELQIMIDGLDRNNETVAKYLQEYHQFASELYMEKRIELISDLVKSNLGWKVKDFRGMTFEEVETKFNSVWKQLEDFIPIGSKENAKRIKRKGLSLEQESAKKQKISEEVTEEAKSSDEVPKEKVKEMMQLVPIEEVYVEPFKSNIPLLTRMFTMRDIGATGRLQVEWKLYDSCGVHHVTSKDKEIFMLVEKDYPLRKGLALVMISYKLQVKNYSQMGRIVGTKMQKAFLLPVIEFLMAEELPTSSKESCHCQKKSKATAVKIALLSKVVAAAKLPILNPNEFDLWKIRIEQYFLMTNYSLWEVILNEQWLAKKNELKARGTLLMALPDKHQLKFDIHKDAKSLMEAIEKRFRGNKETKKVQKTLLKQQYENFSGTSLKSLDQIHDRLQKLISQLEILDEPISQEDINLKFLRSLPSEWKTHTLIWRNKAYLKEQSLDDLFNNLKIYEAEVKVTAASSISAASSKAIVSTLSNVDSLSDAQIDLDDLEEIDLKWQMAMLTIRARRFLKRTGRNLSVNGTETIGFDMSKVECYNCHRRGHFAREIISPRDNRNTYTPRKTILVEVSTSHALVSQCSSSSLRSDNKSQVNDKTGLGFDSQVFNSQVPDCEELHSHESDNTVPKSPENDSESVANVFNVDSSINKPRKDMSKTLRPDAPVVEDWVSDSEDETEIESVPKQREPSFFPTSKHVKTCRESVKKVEHHKQAANLKTNNQKSRGHKKNWNNKACFVYRILNHLIKDCDYYKKQMVQKPVWNSAMRVNHQNLVRMTHPHLNRNVVPTTVLTRSRLMSLNAARPVPTVVPHSTVKSPRPVKHVVNKAHSLVKRPINQRPATKNSHFNKKVTTVKVNKVNVVQGTKGNAKKASANWGNLQQALKDKCVIDSGCSRHMTGNISFLSDFDEINEGYVAFGGNPKGGKIYGKGKIKTCKLDFDDVYFIKEIKFNLSSVSQMCDKKNNVLFTNTKCVVLSFDFKLPDENHVLLRVPRENNMYNVDLKNAEAVNTACYVQNKVLVTNPHNKTPYELLLGRSPSIGFMRPFGCLVTIINTLDPLQSLMGRLMKDFFVGYSVNCKAFRVFNSRTMIVQDTLHINFLENKPNDAWIGPKWLFDINTLTMSMNYQLVVAGNQPNDNACIKENIDAGKVRKETISAQQYMLLPLWSTGSQDPQNTDDDVVDAVFDVKENKNDVHVSANGSDKTDDKKHDGKAKRDVKGKSPIASPIGVTDLRAEFDEFSFNSTNMVNAVSAPVNAAGPNPTNNTNNFNTVSPFDTVVSLNFGIARKSSFVDPSKYPDDPNMPELEDIVYSDDEEDVGAEADLSNLETNIPVSPIPTTRVHKGHPVNQIIGDLNSAPQTRSMTRMVKEQDLPKGKRSMGSKWVFRNKKDKRGIMIWNKARLVAQGHTQEKGIDYDEVFAPVERIKAIWLFLAYASFMDFMVYKVVKALYGFHQAPRAWYETLASYLLENGFQRGKIDQNLFIKKQKGEILLVQVYVDAIIFGSTNKEPCKAFEKLMKDKFQMSSIGELTLFLGLQVKQKDDGIFISQDKCVAEILRKFGFTDVKSASTPIETEKPLLKDPDGEDVDVHIYKSMIGSLMYLTSSKPDIMFAVCACARFQVTPKVSHLHAVKRIFRYLKGKPHLGLWYPRDSPFKLATYFDSDYARASLDRKSTTGGCQFLVLIEAQQHISNESPLVGVNTPRCDEDSIEIKELMATAMVKKVNDVVQLRVLIDGKKVIVSEAIIRRDLHLDDSDGVECLTNEENFEELARMGYEKPPPKLTFYKAFFSAQWKFLIHTLVQCLSAKRTTWNDMVRNVDSPSKFLMYLHFLQVVIDNQVNDMTIHNTRYTSPALIQKVFVNIRKVGKGFSGVETPLFASMLVQPQPQAKEEFKEQPTTTSESSISLLATLMKTCATPSKKVVKCSRGCIQIGRGEKIEAINVDEDITLVDVKTNEEVVVMDGEPQGRINQEDVNTASKDVSVVEPIVFDDEDVTMTMAQTLIKLNAEKAKLLDEQMAQKLWII
nr:putative ribonuclease H-like domain-containing protein [Tanacetum cinerariifolium]